MSRFFQTSKTPRYQLPINIMSKALQSRQQEYDQFQKGLQESISAVADTEAILPHHKQYVENVKKELQEKSEKWSEKDLSQPDVQKEIQDEINKYTTDPNLENIKKTTEDYKSLMESKETQISEGNFSKYNWYPIQKEVATAQQISLDDTGGKAKRVRFSTPFPREDLQEKFNSIFKEAEPSVKEERISGKSKVGRERYGLAPNEKANVKVTTLSRDEMTRNATSILDENETRQIQNEFNYLKETGNLPTYVFENEQGEKEERTPENWAEYATMQASGMADIHDISKEEMTDVSTIENPGSDKTTDQSEEPEAYTVTWVKNKREFPAIFWNEEQNQFVGLNEFKEKSSKVKKITNSKSDLLSHLTEKSYNEDYMSNFSGLSRKDAMVLKEDGVINYGYGQNGNTVVPSVNITKEDIAKVRLRAQSPEDEEVTQDQIQEYLNNNEINQDEIDEFETDVKERLEGFKRQEQIADQFDNRVEKKFKKDLSPEEKAVYEGNKNSKAYKDAKIETYQHLVGAIVGSPMKSGPEGTKDLGATLNPKKNINERFSEEEINKDFKKIADFGFERNFTSMEELMNKWQEEGMLKSTEDWPASMEPQAILKSTEDLPAGMKPQAILAESFMRGAGNTLAFLSKPVSDIASLTVGGKISSPYSMDKEKFKKNFDKIKPILDKYFNGINVEQSGDDKQETILTQGVVSPGSKDVETLGMQEGIDTLVNKAMDLTEEDVKNRKSDYQDDALGWVKESNVKSTPVFRYSQPVNAGEDLVSGDAHTKGQVNDNSVYKFENFMHRQYGVSKEEKTTFYSGMNEETTGYFANNYNNYTNLQELEIVKPDDKSAWVGSGTEINPEIGEKYSPEEIISDKQDATNYGKAGDHYTGLHYRGFRVDQETGKIKGVFDLVRSDGSRGATVEGKFAGNSFSKQFHDSVGDIKTAEKTLKQINKGLNFGKDEGEGKGRKKTFNGRLALLPKSDEEGNITHKNIKITKRKSATGENKFVYKTKYDISDDEYENIISSLKNTYESQNPSLNLGGREISWNQMTDEQKETMLPSKEELDLSDQTFNNKLEMARSLQQINNYFETSTFNNIEESTGDITVDYNNPLALRYAGQRKAKEGERGKTENISGFANFNSLKEGWNAGLNQIKLYQTGESSNVEGIPTVNEFIKLYAPTHENDTENYKKKFIEFVNKETDSNIDENTTLDEIYTETIAKAIAKIEGGGYENLIDQGIIE